MNIGPEIPLWIGLFLGAGILLLPLRRRWPGITPIILALWVVASFPVITWGLLELWFARYRD